MCLAINAGICIANEIIRKNKEGNKEYTVDYYKLHKLLYISQGIMLAEFNKPMFKEDITAHSCGVFISSYQGDKYLGGLDPYYSKYDIKEVTEEIDDPIGQLLTSDRKRILEYVAEKYGTIGKDTLILMTKEHQPYVEAYADKSKEKSEPVLPLDKIKEFFLNNKSTLYPDI